MKSATKISISIFFVLMVGMVSTLLLNCKKEEQSIHKGTVKSLTALVFNPDLTYGTMTDQEGNTYKTIIIGTQTWMAENLRVTKYRNGDAIPNVTGSVAWMELTSAAYCNYNNEEKYSKIYGRLYNDYAAHDSRNIAPVGWHLPTLNDWRILIYNADPNAVFQRDGRSDSNAGIKLKETGFTHWTEAKSSISGTNETGFTAVPGGFRNPYGRNNESRFVEGLGGWWSSDSNPRQLTNDYNDMDMLPSTSINHYGYSIRLIKD